MEHDIVNRLGKDMAGIHMMEHDIVNRLGYDMGGTHGT
jgi:hypothetical protein